MHHFIITGCWGTNWSVHLLEQQAHTAADIATCNKTTCLMLKPPYSSFKDIFLIKWEHYFSKTWTDTFVGWIPKLGEISRAISAKYFCMNIFIQKITNILFVSFCNTNNKIQNGRTKGLHSPYFKNELSNSHHQIDGIVHDWIKRKIFELKHCHDQ